MALTILNDGICRANGKVYEKLSVSGLPHDAKLTILPPRSRQSYLPCRLIQLASNSDACSFVVVYPVVKIRDSSYQLAVLNSNGELIETVERKVSFESIKWQSRYNYRFNKPLCSEIRLIDENSQCVDSFRVEINRVIPCPTHIIVRGTITAPLNDGAQPSFTVLCLDETLSPTGEKVIPMGQRTVPSTFCDSIHECVFNFSVHLPWNQERFFFVAWNAASPFSSAATSLTRDQYEKLIDETNRLFMHAGADPYYAEWFAAHRAKPYELSAQRRISFSYEPLFSIIVPLFRTPRVFFQEMLQSVLGQTYQNWEMILVNASPESTELCTLVEEACANDTRVKSIQLESNRGISLNTNAGIAQATGDFICFFDHDDIIEPNLLFEYVKALNKFDDIDLLYCDEDKLNPAGEFCAPYFKPDFNLDLLRGNNYICHLLTIRRSVMSQLTANTPEYDGAQDHNTTLKAIEIARRVHHVPQVLYHWRISASSTAGNADSKPYANIAGIKAVKEHLERQGIHAEVTRARFSFMYAVHYLPPESHPLVSIIIPTSDHIETLDQCIRSIREKTTYDNYEIVLVDNNSSDPLTTRYYEQLLSDHSDVVSVFHWNGAFNFSKLINYGVQKARGDYLLLLNNDTEVITPEWIDRLVGICSRSEVGAAGVRLYYPDNTIQHAGIVVVDRDAGHFCQDMPRGDNWGYFNLADCQRDLSAVTAACMMTKRSAFDAVGGFEESLAIAFNDVDYCLKLREKGLLVVYTPEVELYHYESLSRGFDHTTEQLERNHQERAYLYKRWFKHYAHGDPYYTPNLRETIELARYYHF